MQNSISEGLKQITGTDRLPTDFEHGYRLVIKGDPGAGKTALGLHILHHHLSEKPKESGLSQGLIVYFQEHPTEFDKVAGQFGLDFKSHPPDTQRIEEVEFKENFPFIRNWVRERGDGESTPLCILIDGLTLLKVSEPSKIHRYVINLLTDVVRKNILLVVLAEEAFGTLDNFFDYMADAVISLSKSGGTQRHRFFEIQKMRYLDHVRGTHGFEMYWDSQQDKSVLQIYPRVRSARIKSGGNNCALGSFDSFKESGIEGLDQVIWGTPKVGSFEPGDVFVITAEPGTDKMGIGLSFLSPVFDCCHHPKAVWLSFGEGDISKSIKRDPLKTRFPEIAAHFDVPANQKKGGEPQFLHASRANRAVHPDRIACTLVNALADSAPARVVIDGLSALEFEFDDARQIRKYLIRISRTIKANNAFAIIFIDLPAAFTSIGNLHMPWSDSVDFIGHLRWYEINNELEMTFSLSKSRHPSFSSFPYHVRKFEEKDKSGRMQLEDRGWPMVSMLSGRMDQIHEAKVFLKFFDQNYSARCVHGPILKDFKKRYSSDQKFAHVFRTAPSPKHWSFRGYKGAGHSNTKVVCLKQYIMDILQEDRKLIAFPTEELERYALHLKDSKPGEEYVKSGSYSIWGLANRRKDVQNGPVQSHILPLYADLGVLCCQIDPERLKAKADRELGENPKLEFAESLPDSPPNRWNDLFKFNYKFQTAKGRRTASEGEYYYPPWIENIFAMPSLSLDAHCFFVFFLEILFDHSALSADSLKESLESKSGLMEIIDSKAFDATIKLLRQMVLTGVSKTPLEKIHYHNAYFSRRWFSQIDQYPVDDPKLPDIEKYLLDRSDPNFKEDRTNWKDRFAFSIAHLPSCDVSKDPKATGIPCLEFYSVGIIRGALAPETAFMFISELASSGTDLRRFEDRRGLPILRDNWSSHPNITQRIGDKKVLDEILQGGRFFCNIWIPGYWQIESKVSEWGRRIFIKKNGEGVTPVDISEEPPEEVESHFLHPTDQLRDELLKFCEKE